MHNYWISQFKFKMIYKIIKKKFDNNLKNTKRIKLIINPKALF